MTLETLSQTVTKAMGQRDYHASELAKVIKAAKEYNSFQVLAEMQDLKKAVKAHSARQVITMDSYHEMKAYLHSVKCACDKFGIPSAER